MKRMKHKSDGGGSGCSENDYCSIVLYPLEFRKKMLRIDLEKQTHTAVLW